MKRKFFYFYRQKGLWWFRIFGYGISWKSLKYHNLLFSERIGKRGFRIGRWMFHFLTKITFIKNATYKDIP